MKEINESVKKEFLNSLNAARTAAGLAIIADNEKRNIGNNGYTLGQSFIATGKIEPVTVDINGRKSVYIGVECENGVMLSLQRLMNISSLKGYSTTEMAINQTREKLSENSPVTETEVKPEVIENFDFADVWQPETRDLYDEAAYLVEHPEVLKGKKITYLGTVVRQLVAKKDSNRDNFELYLKGDKRAMSAPLFSIE